MCAHVGPASRECMHHGNALPAPPAVLPGGVRGSGGGSGDHPSTRRCGYTGRRPSLASRRRRRQQIMAALALCRTRLQTGFDGVCVRTVLHCRNHLQAGFEAACVPCRAAWSPVRPRRKFTLLTVALLTRRFGVWQDATLKVKYTDIDYEYVCRPCPSSQRQPV